MTFIDFIWIWRAANRLASTRPAAVRLLATAMLALSSAHALADCVVLQSQNSFATPVSLNSPRDAKKGQYSQIGEWFKLKNTPTPQFRCSGNSNIYLIPGINNAGNVVTTVTDSDGKSYSGILYSNDAHLLYA